MPLQLAPSDRPAPSDARNHTKEKTIEVDYWVASLAEFSLAWEHPSRDCANLVVFVEKGERLYLQLCEDVVQAIEDPTVMDASYWLLHLAPLRKIVELGSAGAFARIWNEPGSNAEPDSDDPDYSSDSDQLDDEDTLEDSDALGTSYDSDYLDDSVDSSDNSDDSDVSDDDSDDSEDDSWKWSNPTSTRHLIDTLYLRLPPKKQSAYTSLLNWSDMLISRSNQRFQHKGIDALTAHRIHTFLRRIEASQAALFHRLTGERLGQVVCANLAKGGYLWGKQYMKWQRKYREECGKRFGEGGENPVPASGLPSPIIEILEDGSSLASPPCVPKNTRKENVAQRYLLRNRLPSPIIETLADGSSLASPPCLPKKPRKGGGGGRAPVYA
ncbi:MAG: hypothetical protein Q9212_005240 [Teloschistes hypoglaucus]